MRKEELSIYGQLEFDHLWAKSKLIIQTWKPDGDARNLQLTDTLLEVSNKKSDWHKFMWLLLPPNTLGPKSMYRMTKESTFHDILIEMTIYSLEWLDSVQRRKAIENADVPRPERTSRSAWDDGDLDSSG